jgi:hypothetical protein
MAVEPDIFSAFREAAEEVVLDVMDFVSGWSSPHMQV